MINLRKTIFLQGIERPVNMEINTDNAPGMTQIAADELVRDSHPPFNTTDDLIRFVALKAQEGEFPLEGFAKVSFDGPGHGWVEFNKDAAQIRLRYATSLKSRGSTKSNKLLTALHKVYGDGRHEEFWAPVESRITCDDFFGVSLVLGPRTAALGDWEKTQHGGIRLFVNFDNGRAFLRLPDHKGEGLA